jgi:hypothetical protein
MAHAAGFDADADVACGRIKQRFLSKLKLAFAHYMHCAIGGHVVLPLFHSVLVATGQNSNEAALFDHAIGPTFPAKIRVDAN